MISNDCNLADLAGALRNKDYYEVIRLADREATEAERIGLKGRVDAARRRRCGKEYAELLKHFIAYVRYGVVPRGLSPRDLEIFQSLTPADRPRPRI
ncbi:MAG: hypothetical protein MUC46_09010 [Desulfobacterales bacterium]|jgi:hypothetical protein|nr:hypothetical protein [Desulfobacterales bacterium]